MIMISHRPGIPRQANDVQHLKCACRSKDSAASALRWRSICYFVGREFLAQSCWVPKHAARDEKAGVVLVALGVRARHVQEARRVRGLQGREQLDALRGRPLHTAHFTLRPHP